MSSRRFFIKPGESEFHVDGYDLNDGLGDNIELTVEMFNSAVNKKGKTKIFNREEIFNVLEKIVFHLEMENMIKDHKKEYEWFRNEMNKYFRMLR